jgi:SnoaL-like polyketide cyclase
MDIVDLVAEDEKVVGRFRCSATQLGQWRGQPPTGRRFERVDEVYIFRVRDGLITEAWAIEGARARERQLGSHPGAELPSSRTGRRRLSRRWTPRTATRPRRPSKSEPAWLVRRRRRQGRVHARAFVAGDRVGGRPDRG